VGDEAPTRGEYKLPNKRHKKWMGSGLESILTRLGIGQANLVG
jgi:hypothetical protein